MKKLCINIIIMLYLMLIPSHCYAVFIHHNEPDMFKTWLTPEYYEKQRKRNDELQRISNELAVMQYKLNEMKYNEAENKRLKARKRKHTVIK